MDWLAEHARPIGDSILYSVIGIFVLMAFFWLVETILPFSMRKEIEEDHNTALGMILGAFIIAIAIIIGAAIRG